MKDSNSKSSNTKESDTSKRDTKNSSKSNTEKGKARLPKRSKSNISDIPERVKKPIRKAKSTVGNEHEDISSRKRRSKQEERKGSTVDKVSTQNKDRQGDRNEHSPKPVRRVKSSAGLARMKASLSRTNSRDSAREVRKVRSKQDGQNDSASDLGLQKTRSKPRDRQNDGSASDLNSRRAMSKPRDGEDSAKRSEPSVRRTRSKPKDAENDSSPRRREGEDSAKTNEPSVRRMRSKPKDAENDSSPRTRDGEKSSKATESGVRRTRSKPKDSEKESTGTEPGMRRIQSRTKDSNPDDSHQVTKKSDPRRRTGERDRSRSPRGDASGVRRQKADEDGGVRRKASHSPKPLTSQKPSRRTFPSNTGRAPSRGPQRHKSAPLHAMRDAAKNELETQNEKHSEDTPSHPHQDDNRARRHAKPEAKHSPRVRRRQLGAEMNDRQRQALGMGIEFALQKQGSVLQMAGAKPPQFFEEEAPKKDEVWKKRRERASILVLNESASSGANKIGLTGSKVRRDSNVSALDLSAPSLAYFSKDEEEEMEFEELFNSSAPTGGRNKKFNKSMSSLADRPLLF